MKFIIKKILFTGAVTLVFCLGLLISFVFTPSFLYARETTFKNFTIYHTKELDRDLINRVDESFDKLKNQELFDGEIKLDICLNDGSIYPKLIKALMGPDVITSFANKTIIHGDNPDLENNDLIFKDWNQSFKLSQWLTHSFTHCLQYKKYGLFGSNPIAGHDEWKWEGYAEYTSFGTDYDLNAIVKKHMAADDFWVAMEDGSKTNRNHLKFLAMMKYCLEIKHMTYDEVLASKDSSDKIYSELMSWYNDHLKE